MPHEVERIAHRSTKKISWLVAEISFQQPRLGLRSLVLLSIHLSCKYAKRFTGARGLGGGFGCHHVGMLDRRPPWLGHRVRRYVSARIMFVHGYGQK